MKPIHFILFIMLGYLSISCIEAEGREIEEILRKAGDYIAERLPFVNKLMKPEMQSGTSNNTTSPEENIKVPEVLNAPHYLFSQFKTSTTTTINSTSAGTTTDNSTSTPKNETTETISPVSNSTTEMATNASWTDLIDIMNDTFTSSEIQSGTPNNTTSPEEEYTNFSEDVKGRHTLFSQFTPSTRTTINSTSAGTTTGNSTSTPRNETTETIWTVSNITTEEVTNATWTDLTPIMNVTTTATSETAESEATAAPSNKTTSSESSTSSNTTSPISTASTNTTSSATSASSTGPPTETSKKTTRVVTTQVTPTSPPHLTRGEVAAIVIGCLLVASILAAGIIYFVKRRVRHGDDQRTLLGQ